MPSLLRLNSVGENSSAGSVPLNNNGIKNIFPNPRANKLLSKSKMTTMKSLALNSNRQPYYQSSVSFSGTSEPQAHSLLLPSKPFNLLFDPSYSRLLPGNILQQLMTPNKTPHSFTGTPGRSLSDSMDSSMLTGIETCPDAMNGHKRFQPMKNHPSYMSAANIKAFTPHCSSESVVPFQSEVLGSENRIKDSASNMKIMEYAKSLPAVSTDCSKVNFAYNTDVEKGSKQSAEEFYSCELSDGSLQNGHVSSNSDKEKGEIVSSRDNSTSHCTFKSISNLSLILSTPRKTAKKGRPSSKKQKKRQRAKRRHGSPPLQSTESNSSSHIKHNINHNSQSESQELSDSLPDNLESSSPLFQKASSEFQSACKKLPSPVADSTKWCPIAKLFFRANSVSEEADDEDEDNDRNNENDHEGDSMFPIEDFGFNCALSLDSIFKQKSIPCLRSVLSVEESNGANLKSSRSVSNVNGRICRKLSESHSEDDNADDSGNEYCATDLSSQDSSCGFSTGLLLSKLFPQKSTSNSQNCINLTETEVSVDLLDGPSSKSKLLQSSSHETDIETISRINAKWNENYPTSGFRSCCSVSSDEIQDPSIKVHFAKEPHLLTVHVVGAEDRAGSWRHDVLDRERFERRIMELEKVISPVLEASHRAKIQSRYKH